jgi:hypothetical protein
MPRQEYKYEQRHYNPEALKTNYQDTYVPQQINNFVDSPSKLESYGVIFVLFRVKFYIKSPLLAKAHIRINLNHTRSSQYKIHRMTTFLRITVDQLLLKCIVLLSNSKVSLLIKLILWSLPKCRRSPFRK